MTNIVDEMTDPLNHSCMFLTLIIKCSQEIAPMSLNNPKILCEKGGEDELKMNVCRKHNVME